MTVKILDNDIGQLMLVEYEGNEWYAFQFDSGTVLLFREEDGILDFKVEP